MTVYGYFNFKTYGNPNYNERYHKSRRKIMIDTHILDAKSFLKTISKLNFDRLLYDAWDKPSQSKFKTFLNMILYYINENDILVVLSLFQLGDSKERIYRVLAELKQKNVRLFVTTQEVDISEAERKVLELSLDDLAIYENKQYWNQLSSYIEYYSQFAREIAGYSLDEQYIKNKTLGIETTNVVNYGYDYSYNNNSYYSQQAKRQMEAFNERYWNRKRTEWE